MKITYATQTSEMRTFGIKQIETVQASNVLVLSAHSGDEVFACGGLIAHLAETADHIKVVYFSDKLEFESDDKNDAEVMRVQEKEAVNGLRILGLHEVNFLRMKEISLHENIALKILEELKTREWDLVILPSRNDWGLEHQVINSSFQTALKYKLGYSPSVLQYGLFGVAKPDVLFPFDKYSGAKEEAMGCHKSILKERDMLHATFGMSSYLGNIMGLGRHAEGYIFSG